MARITVEDCLEREQNRFALVQLASKRTKQLLHGSRTTIEDPRGNKAVVTALREIAEGTVRFMTEDEASLERERLASENAVSLEEALRTSPATLTTTTPSPSDGGSAVGEEEESNLGSERNGGSPTPSF